MTEWTPEKLDALPGATMITATPWGSTPDLFIGLDHDNGRDWHGVSRGSETSAWLTDPTNIDPNSINVVSVPIDALLSEGALMAAAEAQPLPKPYLLDSRGIRAAIAHVTGEPA